MSDILYTDSLEGISSKNLEHLHVGWCNPPSPGTHLKSLRNMNAIMLAVERTSGDVVGFISGMTDETLILFIWDIEVRPEYQRRGIGMELVRRLLEKHGDIYQVNLHTDARTRPFYERLGFVADPELFVGMTRMNMDLQDGGSRAVMG